MCFAVTAVSPASSSRCYDSTTALARVGTEMRYRITIHDFEMNNFARSVAARDATFQANDLFTGDHLPQSIILTRPAFGDHNLPLFSEAKRPLGVVAQSLENVLACL
jgi:hypothetical protein